MSFCHGFLVGLNTSLNLEFQEFVSITLVFQSWLCSSLVENAVITKVVIER